MEGPLVSVVIPALNEAEQIGETIAAARRDYGVDEVEVIVVDGGSTDGTPDLVPPSATLARAPRGRAAQMNHGACLAHGEALVFCHADTQLPPGWREAVLEALECPGVAGGAFWPRLVPTRGMLHFLHLLSTTSVWWTIYGDHAQYMRRATYARVGGFREQPFLEDVEMARALHRAGRMVRLPLRVRTSSRRFLERGPIKQAFTDMWCLARYLILGATAEELVPLYRSSREKALVKR